jgi:hypothetical protein
MFHAWCGVISDHLQARKVMISKDTVKQLVLRQLGNVKLIDNVPGMPADIVAMGSSHYKRDESELTKNDNISNFISMSELLTKMEAWAATDLDLILQRETNEKKEQCSETNRARFETFTESTAGSDRNGRPERGRHDAPRRQGQGTARPGPRD